MASRNIWKGSCLFLDTCGPLACWVVRVYVSLQVVVNYVAMTPQGRIFENSLEKQPFDIRVGSGQVLPGLDEGLSTMKVCVGGNSLRLNCMVHSSTQDTQARMQRSIWLVIYKGGAGQTGREAPHVSVCCVSTSSAIKWRLM